MNFLIIITLFYDWFYRDYTNALIEEGRCKEYFEKKIKIDTLSNPFYHFKIAFDLERKGLFLESIERLKKAISLSQNNISYLVRFYIVSLEKKNKSFEEKLREALIFLREKNEWDGIYFLSAYLLSLSKDAFSFREKEFFLKESILFSPDFYPAYTQMIKMYIEEFKFFKAIESVLEFTGLIFKSTFLRKFLFLIFIKLFFFSFYYFLIMFTIGKIISYSGCETIYLKKFFKTPFPFLLLFEIIFILLAIPSPFHLILLFPLYPFFKRKEKILFLFFVLIVLSIFYWGNLESGIEKYYHKENYPLFLKRFQNIPSSKKILMSLKEENVFEANLKGILIFKEKGVDSALYYFKKLLKNNPDDPYILLNIGNIYYFKNNYDSADFYYKNSLQKKPEFYEAHFNIAQVSFKKFDLYSYETKMREAQEINYHEAIKKTFRIKEYGAQEVFWGIHDVINKKISVKGEIERLYAFPVSAIFSIFLFIAIIFLFRRKKEILSCHACGKFCHDIFKIEPNFEVCDICAQEILKTESLKIRERIFNKIRIENILRKRLLILILNLFIPSIGFLYSGSHILFIISYIFLFIGFYTAIILKVNILWIIFYMLYLVIFVFPYYYFKEVKIGTSR
ncbi:MAG: hypothetical protein ABIM29_02330 [candidate division WOR-3 bacterium]